MKKLTFGFMVAALSLSLNAKAGTDIGSGNSSLCENSAKDLVKAIMSTSNSADDMKKFEIRGAVVNKSGPNELNPFLKQETLTVTFGWKDSELSYENYDTQLIMTEIPQGSGCSLNKYESKF
jgi:hypothetical protein